MTIAQKFWVERVLGRGGMGVVVAATHLQLGQRVALKFLHTNGPRDAEAIERFLREARSAVSLRSEHVGRVLDVGQTDDGAPYIVMEYLDGADLGSRLARAGALPVATAVDYVLQACLAVGEAHAAGIVHRDLKPSNLFLTRRPEGTPLIKVLDFGIAKARGRMDARLTDSAAIMGSPGYMSPELLKSSRDVDARTDVWALGVCLYELTTRVKPFDADTFAEMAAKVAMDPPPRLPAGLPRGFVAAILRCLEKEPAARFADVGALARAIAPFGSPGADTVAAGVTRLVAAAPAVAKTDPVAAVMAATTLSRAASSRATAPAVKMRRRFWLGVSAGAGIAVLGAAIVAVALSGGGGGAAGANTEPAAAPAAAVTIDAGVEPVDAAAPVVAPLDAAAPVEVAPAEAPARRPKDRPRSDRPPAAERSTGGPASPPRDPIATPPPPPVVDEEDRDGDGIPDKR